MALRNILTLGTPAQVNFAYADLKELELAAQDILLLRLDRHDLPLFEELRLF